MSGLVWWLSGMLVVSLVSSFTLVKVLGVPTFGSDIACACVGVLYALFFPLHRILRRKP